MNYEIPPDIEKRLKEHLINGAYSSTDDLLRDAMDALDQVEQEKILRWRERNRQAIVESAAGLSKPLNEQALLGRLRERLSKEGIVG